MKLTIVDTDNGLFHYEGVLWENRLDEEYGYLVLADSHNGYPIKLFKKSIIKAITKDVMVRADVIEDQILYERETKAD